jgi:hypothetical protein
LIDSLPPGQYSYNYTDINGCFANGSLSVTQPELLEMNVEVTDQVGEEAGSAMITVDGGTPPYFIFWSNGAVNETAQDSLTTGFYAIWLKDLLGCKAQSLFYIDFIQSALSQESLELKFYPNPVSDFLIIESLTNSPSYIQLRQIDGKLLMDKKLPASDKHSQIDFRDFPRGVYILSIESGTQMVNRRLIKK